MKILKSLFISLLLFSFIPIYSYAGPIKVALDGLKFVVKNQTSVAMSFAVAHTLGGTGAATAGLCGPKFSVTGAGVACNSSDFFAHPLPTGNDSAIANAFGASWLLGFRGTASAFANASKGDFAAAGAYARGGAAASAIDGSLASTGLVKASGSFSLGGLTVRGSKDPATAFYGVVVSDQPTLELNQPLLSTEIEGMSLESLVLPVLPDELSMGVPDNIFYALLLTLDGATGALDIQNFGSGVISPITLSDFTDMSTAAESIYEYNGPDEVFFDIPFTDLSAEEQVITFDAMHFIVAVSSPSPLVQLIAFLLLAVLYRRKSMIGNWSKLSC